MRRTGMIPALILGCVFVGCRKSTIYTAEDGARTTVTIRGSKGAGVWFESTGGETQIAGERGLVLLDGFPKDVPVYPGATVRISTASKDPVYVHVTLETADPASKVAAFYKEKLKENGWEIEDKMNTEGMSTASAKKKRSVMAMTKRDSGGSIITLTVQEEKK